METAKNAEREAGTSFRTVARSLVDLIGEDYVRQSCRARSFLAGEDPEALYSRASRPVDFFPDEMRRRLEGMLDQKIGRASCRERV